MLLALLALQKRRYSFRDVQERKSEWRDLGHFRVGPLSDDGWGH